ncbi:MAG TPA: pyridoxal-phosphate dependent enzyme [Bacteroidales bacterium]|nr:pyridoxal-phosphate dependent enzyme [Bacteroidales bacterium]HPT09841.1 pyridoxal-phosphate dependent enzyme [Bacteroidales bacterium]
MANIFHYECCNCGHTISTREAVYLCPVCEPLNKPGQPPLGVLKVIYPDAGRLLHGDPETRFRNLKNEGFLPLLPLPDLTCQPPLRIGNTPLYKLDNFYKPFPGNAPDTSLKAPSHVSDSPEIFIKDDSQNPTFSFKDRASALVSGWAAAHGKQTIIAASTGNAGSSLAGICASQRQRAVIFVPASAPRAKLTQIVMYGARIIPVRGNYDMAFDLTVKASRLFGFYNRNTAFNPLTVEGKKLAAMELYEQLGFRCPDRLFIPVGDGVILAGLYKGFEDLLHCGIIEQIPVIIAVQAEGSRNLMDNLHRGQFIARSSSTIADSISVDIPRNFHMAAGFLKKYQGETIAVTDQEIIEAAGNLARMSGIFAEPAAAAAFAGLLKYNREERLSPGSKNVALLTGSGLKDPEAVRSAVVLPEPFDPEKDTLEHLFEK